MKTKEQVFYELFEEASEKLSNRGCNDYEVPNTPEFYDMLMQFGMRNLNCKTIEEFKAHKDYEDYKPRVSEDQKQIDAMDFEILGCFKHILLESGIIRKK